MERITITIDEDLLATVDGLTARHGYPSRSEAIRDLIRVAATKEEQATGQVPCVATLSYVYDHATRDLSQRLTQAQHEHHHLGIATTHVHFNHDSCLEVAILQGSIDQVRAFAEAMTVQRGVRHASLHVIPLSATRSTHSHGPDFPDHDHSSI